MKLNRAELRKIIYDFNSISNRLLQADYNDYSDVLSKFICHMRSCPIIFDYITGCGECEQNLDQEFKEVRGSYGRSYFSLGDTTDEEVRNVYATLNYIIDNNLNVALGIGASYSTSNKYQDRVKGFNDRVVMVLIRHIENFLTKVGIDMGIDEKITYSITVENGQVNIANDNATITATNSIGIDSTQLKELMQTVRAAAKELSPEDAETMESSLEVIEAETQSEKPRKGFLKTSINGLKVLKGTAEFGAAIAALIQFIQPLL